MAYGARLERGLGFIAPRGFKSRILRQSGRSPVFTTGDLFIYVILALTVWPYCSVLSRFSLA